jgi:two-component system, NarL family, response regulator NreC
VRELKQYLPNVRVLILTVHSEHEQLLPLLEAGARGYLTKEATSRDRVEAIRVVATGEVYVRPAAARLLASDVIPEHTARTARGRFQTLSDREQTTLRMLAEGYSGAEIAPKLGISTKTVDAYKRRVQEKARPRAPNRLRQVCAGGRDLGIVLASSRYQRRRL